ncbi:MAG: hypothetical protein AABY22_07405 [Nanoarchaeota archaeon]
MAKKKRYWVCAKSHGFREQCSSFKSKTKAKLFTKRLREDYKSAGMKRTKVKITRA